MFRKTFLFVGNVVLVVTIVTATNINTDLRKSTIKTKPRYSYLQSRLIDRGIDEDIAQELVNKKINISEEAVYILSQELNLSKDIIYDKILDKALRDEYVDLTNKATLIALAQSLNGGFIHQDTLDEIHSFKSDNQLLPV